MIVGSVSVGTNSIALVHRCTTPAGVNVILCTTGAVGDAHFGNADVQAAGPFAFHMAVGVDALTVRLPQNEALYATTSAAASTIRFAVIGN